MIIKNAIRCNIYYDENDSTYRYDFVVCKYGAGSVDEDHNHFRCYFVSVNSNSV